MYDSRSSHPRTGGHHHRAWQRKSTGGHRYEGKQMKHDFTPKRLLQPSAGVAVAEALEEVEVEREVRQTIEQAHAEALRFNAMPWFERDYAMYADSPHSAYCDEPCEDEFVDWEAAIDFGYASEEGLTHLEDSAWDQGAYGGYSDDTYLEDGQVLVDCWMPYMRLEEVRETFGENWLGNGFHIISPNTIRSTK